MTDWDEFLKDFIEEEKRKERQEKKSSVVDKSSPRVLAERTDDALDLLSVGARRNRKTKRDVIDLCDGSLPIDNLRASSPPIVDLRASSPPVVDLRASSPPVVDLHASSPPLVDLCDSSSSEEEEKDAEQPPLVVVAPQSRDHLRRFAANRHEMQTNDIQRHQAKTVPSHCPQNGIGPPATAPLRRDHLRRFATRKRVYGQWVTSDGAQQRSSSVSVNTAQNDMKKTVPSHRLQNSAFEARGPDHIQAGKRHSRRLCVQDVGERPADIRFVKQCYVRSGSVSDVLQITEVGATGVTPRIHEEEEDSKRTKSLLSACGSVAHNVDQPHACKTCGKTFTKADKLQDHVKKIHTRGKPYTCEDCAQKFGDIKILKVHWKMHKTQTPPHVCKNCKKRFTDADELKDHVRTHTGGTPYTCKKCGEAFQALHHFEQHMWVHLREQKQFPCPHCGNKFSKERYLTEHNIRKHAGEKPYSCGRCGRGFTASEDLMIHFRSCRAHTSFP